MKPKNTPKPYKIIKQTKVQKFKDGSCLITHQDGKIKLIESALEYQLRWKNLK